VRGRAKARARKGNSQIAPEAVEIAQNRLGNVNRRLVDVEKRNRTGACVDGGTFVVRNSDTTPTCEASTSAAVARLVRLGTLRLRPFGSTGSSRRVSGRVASRKRLLQLLVELLFRR
jgi:hypothetical protein